MIDTGEAALAAARAAGMFFPGELIDDTGLRDDDFYVLGSVDRVDDSSVWVDRATGAAEWRARNHGLDERLEAMEEVPIPMEETL